MVNIGHKESEIMKIIAKPILAGVVALSFLAQSPEAGQHFETPAAQVNPSYDLTDVYVFDSEQAGSTVFMLNVNPATPTDGTVAFAEEGIYAVHLSIDRIASDGMSLTFTFDDGLVTVGKVDTPIPELGTVGEALGSAEIGEDTTLENGMRIWAGSAHDPFVGDAAGIQAFRAGIGEAKFDTNLFTKNDFFGTLTSSVIVLEVPNAMLPEQINVFATSAKKEDGEWTQVNRIGHVLMTHLFLHDSPDLQAAHVSNGPDTDVNRIPALTNSVLRGVILAKSQDNPVAYPDFCQSSSRFSLT
jgi:hypothetical protein